jgi:hypothetical protein
MNKKENINTFLERPYAFNTQDTQAYGNYMKH